MLVRIERVEALYDDVCVVDHVIGLEAERPVPDVLVFGRVVHVLQHVGKVLERQP